MSFTKNRRGLSVIVPLFLLVAIGSLVIGAVMITQSGAISSGNVITTTIDFHSANSGLEWAGQVARDYTTEDQDKWESLDGASYEIEGSGGPRFTLRIDYVDDDNDPTTEDSVTIVSTGSLGDMATANSKREVRISLTVPVSGKIQSFSDHFDQPNTSEFDNQYEFGQADSAHGDMTPYTTSQSEQYGDTQNLFTHSSEAGGSTSVLKMGGDGETRLIIHTEECFKWSSSGLAGSCDYEGCQSSNECEARTGLDFKPDESGYQNYFIKVRARLMSGDGFGIYFRSSYASHDDPYNVDFSSLTAYIWQYDKGLGYLAPCDRNTAILGNNGMGMLITRRVEGGSETCGVDCSIYQSQASPGAYPFFCPENSSNVSILPGWRWKEQDWLISWRTVYIYVFHGKANVYVGRLGIIGYGGEDQPEHVGEIDLFQTGSPLKTGDIGLRTWNGSVIEIDYINIYSNDEDHDTTSYIGD